MINFNNADIKTIIEMMNKLGYKLEKEVVETKEANREDVSGYFYDSNLVAVAKRQLLQTRNGYFNRKITKENFKEMVNCRFSEKDRISALTKLYQDNYLNVNRRTQLMNEEILEVSKETLKESKYVSLYCDYTADIADEMFFQFKENNPDFVVIRPQLIGLSSDDKRKVFKRKDTLDSEYIKQYQTFVDEAIKEIKEDIKKDAQAFCESELEAFKLEEEAKLAKEEYKSMLKDFLNK